MNSFARKMNRLFSQLVILLIFSFSSIGSAREGSLSAVVIFRLSGGELEYAPLLGEPPIIESIVKARMRNLEYFKVVGADYIIVIQGPEGVDKEFGGSLGMMIMEAKQDESILTQFISRKKKIKGRGGIIDSSDIVVKFGDKFKRAR